MREFSGNAHFFDAVEYGGYMYFSETTFNGLFRVKIGEEEAEFLGHFIEEHPWQSDLHRNVFLHGNELYFVPMNGHGVSVYDLTAKSFSFISLVDDKEKKFSFMQSVDIKGKSLLIPRTASNDFLLCDFMNGNFEFLPELSERIFKRIDTEDGQEIFSVYSAVKDNDRLYLAVSGQNIIFKINLNTWDVELFHVPIDIHFRYVNMIGDDLWFTLKEHKVLKWKKEDQSYIVYDIPCAPVDEEYPYLQIVKVGNDMWVMSGREDHFWVFDEVNDVWTDVQREFPSKFKRDVIGPLLFLGYKFASNELLCLYPRSGNGILEYSLVQNTFSFRSIKYSIGFLNQLNLEWVHYLVNSFSVLSENDVDLSNWIISLSQNKILEKKRNNELCFAGNRIYDFIY